MLGIAVVTYKRLAFLQRVIAGITEHTRQPYQLVVAEDGGGDGSAEWARDQGITTVTGLNRGVCWNKNRALFPLFLKGCDPILLLEDDCFPVEPGWEESWITATRRWHHLAYAHPKIAPQAICGDGSADNPYRNPKATAQCTAVSLEAMNAVGFLDTRFSGYGVGHVEWTSRFRRLKAGYEDVQTPEGEVRCNIYISGGLAHEDGKTFRDNRSVIRNRDLFSKIKSDPLFRFPWSSQDERAIFVEELTAAGAMEADALSAPAWAHIESSTPLPAPLDEPLIDVVSAVAEERREKEKKRSEHREDLIESIKSLAASDKRLAPLFNDKKSFLLQSGWLQSFVDQRPMVKGNVVPWLNYGVIRFLSGRLKKQMRLFEYGSGYSTEWFEKRVASVTSVEHDKDWYELVKTRLEQQGSTAELMHRQLDYDGQYCRAITSSVKKYHVVVIDGRDRVNCLKAAFAHLRDNGVFVFDNSQRRHYRPGIDAFMLEHGFRELQFSGPAPLTHVESFTSILYRSGNCFGI